ncbi:MAG: aquaporin [Bauldia sp.]
MPEPADLRRVLAAEAAGTAILVMAVVGSGIMAERLTDDIALALLANTIATAAALFVLVAALGPVSGAHLNPAVTLAFLLRREISARPALAMVAAQIAGGLAGVVLANAMFGVAPLAPGTAARTGAGQWLGEAIAAFGLVATILLVRARRPDALPAAVALFIASAYWFTASTSFANPAVAIARALTPTFAGIRPVDVPPFAVAELAGAVLAVLAVGWLLRPAQNG